jgi:glutathione S-transferase
MKLFHSAGSCSTAALIVIKELGIKCDIIPVDLASDRAELFKHNSRGQVPTLVLDNGEVLTEGAVIIQYLADLKPEMGLLPKAATWERYKAIESLNFVATELHKGLGILFNKSLNDEAKATLKGLAEKKLAFLNTQLANRQFLASNQYTIADAYCFTVVNWTKWVGIDMTPYPNVMSYCERIGQRPAVVAATKAPATV